MRTASKALIGFVTFYVAVLAFTFAGTFAHEMAHAYAWERSAPEVQFDPDRDAARSELTQEKSVEVDGIHYRVIYVDDTTVALYPAAIFYAGATLGLAPAGLMPDSVLGSTFYAYDDSHYEKLAHGEAVIDWHHVAMPMLLNGLFTIPVWAWMIWRPNAFSMAAVWVNTSEWRFNVHHAEELGIPGPMFLAISVMLMMIAAAAITYLAVVKLKDSHPMPAISTPSPS